MSCAGIVDSDFLPSALRFADCQAQTIGMQGYQALTASGSPLAMLLTAFLTILIAIFGYRMLLGHVPDTREGVLTFVKIGLVLALATSWSAYRVVIYDVALRGPAEIVDTIGRGSGIPGASGGMLARLGEIDRALVELSRLGMRGGVPTAVQQDEGVAAGSGQQATAPPQYPLEHEPGTIFGSSSLGTARLVFLAATIAAYASVRLMAGLLLAIGPLFITFLLFDGTRSLFEGWVRALVAAAIGALAVTVTLGVELALLEPWLADLLARRASGLPSSATATEMLVITLAFAMILLAALGMSARLVLGFRLPFPHLRPAAEQRKGASSASSFSLTRDRQILAGAAPSRAAAIAEAVVISQRREARSGVERREVAGAGALQSPSTRARDTMGGPAVLPLGQGYRRRARIRVSASASKRDGTP